MLVNKKDLMKLNKDELVSELSKYMALYDNEKSHSDTLQHIVNHLLALLDIRKNSIDYKPDKSDDFFGKPPYKFTCEGKVDL